MTAKELINELQKQDPNIPVVVAGYEIGYDDVTSFEKFKVVPDYNKKYCYHGNHEKLDNIDKERGSLEKDAIEVLLIY